MAVTIPDPKPLKRETRPVATGIIAGFNKGHGTTRRARVVKAKHARLAAPHKRLRAVKAVIADVVGLTPLEKRVQEMLRVGKEKRALKLCNKRLGNITAAKKKRSRMEDHIRTAGKKK